MISRSHHVSLTGVKNINEALEKANLTWLAEPQELITTGGVNVHSHKAIVRSDTNQTIGVVGIDYTPIQHSTAFGFFDTICEKLGAKYSNAFIFNNGAKVILRASVNTPMKIRTGDEVIKYIDIINGFDGGSKWLAQFTAWRKICANGLYGLATDNKVTCRHTINAEENLKQAIMIFGKSQEFFKKFETACKTLAQKMLTKKMIESFLKQVEGESLSTRKENIHNKINELYEAGKGTGKGTAWDCYNAYTEWLDHHRSSNEENQIYNQVIGTTTKKEKAFDILLKI